MGAQIKVSYPEIPNMGDLLNKYIIEELFEYEVTPMSPYYSDLSGIGSGLGRYLYASNMLRRIKQFFWGIAYPKVSVWGTGFISYSDQDNSFFRRQIKFCAVRGNLTKKRVEKIIGKQLDIPTGDAGILSSLLLKEKPAKLYKVGIIAHFKEQDNPVFNSLVEHYEDSTFIDVRKEPIQVIREIAECECVISSSLHGLILADSLRVPNIHVVVSNKLMGDGYKFDDYYSGYNIKHDFFDGNENVNYPTLDWIKSNYKITDEMVAKKKKDLIRAFPFSHYYKLDDFNL